MDLKWSVELGERPVNAGWLGRFFLGKVEHSFIRIKEGDEAVLELHGLYTGAVGAFFNTVAKMVTGRPRHFCHLRILALTSPRLMNIFRAHFPVKSTTVFTGSKEEVLRMAECFARVGKKINEDRLDYYLDPRHPYGGQACHSFSAEALRRVGIDIVSRPYDSHMPGLGTNLEQVDPNLRTISVDKAMPASQIEAKIGKEITSFSPDIGYSPRWQTSSRPGRRRPNPLRKGMLAAA